MATILIDGQEHTLPDGERINAIQAALRFGIEIPYYCWHPSLSVVANCRMCEIETGTRDPKTGEIRMIPKLVPACQTPAKDGTVLVTDSDKVREHRRMIMEYLLIHHPLDCPVCDQAGMCGLQDFSYEHGQATHRYVEERIANPKKDVSDKIRLVQDRCILCTRCVRFAREITGTSELNVIRRNNHAEIDIFPGRPIDNPLAGNVVDLCPVGALLDKDFLHKQRYWYLAKHDSICTRCATGCSLIVEENKGRIWRFRARFNPKVNDYWICDDGRHSYKAANDPNLLSAMYVRENNDLAPQPIDRAIAAARAGCERIREEKGAILGILSPFFTVEEAFLLARYLKGLNPANVLALGPVPTLGEDVTFTPDPREGRVGDTSFIVCRPFTIHAEKCPNRRGVEAILKHFQGEVIGYEAALERAAKGDFQAAYVTSCAIDPAFTDADVSQLRPHVSFLIVQDVHVTPLAQAADVVLAGSTFAEKAGCHVNFQNRLQYAGASLPPRDGSLPDLDILAIVQGHGVGPIVSRLVLAELAETVPAFAVAKDGQVPAFGIVLGESAEVEAEAAVGGEQQLVFGDAWFKNREDRVELPLGIKK